MTQQQQQLQLQLEIAYYSIKIWCESEQSVNEIFGGRYNMFLILKLEGKILPHPGSQEPAFFRPGALYSSDPFCCHTGKLNPIKGKFRFWHCSTRLVVVLCTFLFANTIHGLFIHNNIYKINC